jgi:dUTP pyrophosphatase
MFRVYCKDIECYPKRAHVTDAGLDLKAAESYHVYGWEVTKIRTGIHIEIPQGFAGFIFPRSGLASKHGVILANSVGVIDSDYRGEIICAMRLRDPDSKYIIQKYERIAQLVIMPVWQGVLENVDELYKLSDTQRGDGGFGHTGKH